MRSTQIAFNPRSPSAWEARLRSVRAIQAAASELKDLVRHANHAGIQVVCEIDGREVNIADLTIALPRPPRSPP
jgi:hypothetical protein